MEIFKEVRTSLNQGETDDDAEARTEIWSIEGDFIHRHHVEPRVAAPRAERRKIVKSTENIDVTRTTHTCQPGRVLQQFQQLPDMTICGQQYGPAQQRQLNGRKEKQHWAIEKPKLDNARKWRGICFFF